MRFTSIGFVPLHSVFVHPFHGIKEDNETARNYSILETIRTVPSQRATHH